MDAAKLLLPIPRAPYHMVGRFVDAISIRNHIDHASYVNPHGAPRAPAIPPAMEIADFLGGNP